MTNDHDNLSDTLIEQNKDLTEILQNPPRIYKKMLDGWYESTLIERNEKGVYPDGFRDLPQALIDKKNKDIRQIRNNLIMFFIEFNVKSHNSRGIDTKARKHGLIKRTETFNIHELIRSSDHVREYLTFDKKHIILSSPYIDDDRTREEHFRYGFKIYRLHLHHESSYTYYLVLE